MDKKVKFTLRLTEEDLEIIESIKGDIGEVTTASAIRYIIRNYASLQIRFHRLIRQGKIIGKKNKQYYICFIF